jgi:hypothetical protein
MALLEELTDTFNTDGPFDPARWPNSYNTAGLPLPAQSGGVGLVAADTGFSAYASAAAYTLQGSHAFARIIPPALGGATGDVYAQLLVLSNVVGTQLVFEVNVTSNLLVMTVQVGFASEGGASIPYEPDAHAWVRVREDAGDLYWDTSPDGREWTNRYSETAPAWVADGDLEAQLLAHRDDGTTDFAAFDDFNVTPTLADGYTVAIDWGSDGDFDGPHDDVTADVLSRGVVEFEYGRDQARQLSPPMVGSMTMDLCNVDRIYSPENPDSPIADDVSPASPVKVEVVRGDVLYPLIRGRIDELEIHPDRDDRSAGITAVDDLSLLRGTSISTDLFEAQRTGTLIGVILDEIGWTAPRDLDLGATFVPWWWAEGQDAFGALTELLESEGPPSIAYVAPDGTFVFRDRHHRLLRPASIVSQATFASRHIGACDPCNDPVELYGDGCYGFGPYGG